MFCICNYYLCPFYCNASFHCFLSCVMKGKEPRITHLMHQKHVKVLWNKILLCLKDRRTISLLKHHAPHHTTQPWRMYSSLITRRNCSYLCFKGTSSSTLLNPHPTSCCYCCCCCSHRFPLLVVSRLLICSLLPLVFALSLLHSVFFICD